MRTKKDQGRTYLQIVESYREGSKVRQRVICTLGRLEELTSRGQVDGIIKSLSKFSEKLKVSEEYAAGRLQAKKVTRIGPDLITARLWEETGLKEIVEGLAGNRKHSFSIERAVYLSVLSRLFFPGSERRAARITRDYRTSGAEDIELHQLYRAMAWLGEERARIEEELFDAHKSLFTSLQVVFFDTTSIYFEGRGGETLGQKGYSKDRRPDYSKDRRPDENQMIVGVVTDQEGRPISCPVWPGNTTDAKTIIPVASSLKKRFGAADVVIVADRGMMGKKNTEAIASLGYPYILGVKMRLEKKAMADVLSRAGRFADIQENLKVKEVTHEGKRYIICLNPDEQKKDRLAREAMIAALQEKLKRGAGQLIGNSGYRRYLKVDSGSVSIDAKKVAQEERYDGKWVLATTTDLPADEVALRYKDLWMVERVFREAKDTLETRPVFHKCDSTILGHVFVSFLALVLMHELKRRIDFPAEWDEIRADLDALYEVEVESEGRTFLLRSPLQGTCGNVFKAVGVAIPPAASLAQV